MPSYKKLRPSQVSLDPQNPRLPDGTSSDREAINRLLDEGADALINLARDLAQTGKTNPSELPIAVKEGPKYLVLEGNRRFAALKLLANPALADDEGHQRAIRRAAALGTPPDTVYTLVAESRQEAEEWIFLRHTGENNGRGVKRWSAGQTATYRRRVSGSLDSGTSRSITIADELEEAYAADREIIELVRKVRREKLTNIGRFFSLDVLAALHLTIESDGASNVREKTLWARHSADQLRDFFAWALGYIDERSVDAYKNAAIRHAALREASHLIPSLTQAAVKPSRLAESKFSGGSATSGGGEPTNGHQGASSGGGGAGRAAGGDDGTGGGAGGQDGGEQPQGGDDQTQGGDDQAQGRSKRRGEGKPEPYLFHRLKLPRHNQRIQNLLRECRDLDLEQWPGVACVMARVIVELSVSSDEALQLSGAKESDSLKEKIVKMLRFLDSDIEHPRKRDPELAQAYLEASELGIQYLNGFVHNPTLRPDPQLARRFSSAFRPFLERVDQAL